MIQISFDDLKHRIEDILERGFYAGRWVLAPMYFVLIVVLVFVIIKFFLNVIDLAPSIITSSAEVWVPELLDLLDLTLIANLVLIVAYSGYENSVSKIDHFGFNDEKISAIGNLDMGALKLKIIGSVVAISIIELLKDFLAATSINPDIEFWKIILHITFVITGLIFARMEMLSAKKKEIKTKEQLNIVEMEQFENL